MKKKFTHLTDDNKPVMVDVGEKQVTKRTATARAIVVVTDEIFDLLESNEIATKKGPVFQTAILAGIMGAKKTGDLIPLCHPLALSKCEVNITTQQPNQIIIDCTAKITAKTGVEMEALTGASIAALTVYDMCKAFSHEITITETRLLKKTGGKSDYEAS